MSLLCVSTLVAFLLYGGKATKGTTVFTTFDFRTIEEGETDSEERNKTEVSFYSSSS